MNESLRELSLRESQLATLEILKRIDSICKAMDIKYWVIFGTLIGAIRHKGFIPWDDDLDIGMSRPDYEKFLKYCNEQKDDLKPFCIHNKDTVDGCWYNITRFCDDRYLCIFERCRKYKKSGLFIDIYPFDGLGKEKDKKYWAKTDFYRWFIFKLNMLCFLTDKFPGKNLKSKIINFPLKLISHLRPQKYYLEILEKKSRKYKWEDSDFVYNATWTAARHMVFLKRSYFDRLMYVDFENIKVPVPQEYDEVLKILFGNYMELPPKEEQKPQHYYKVYKMENSQNE